MEHEATDSTAEAVRRVSRVDRPWVAIGTRLSADAVRVHRASRRHRGLARQPHALRLPRARRRRRRTSRRATRPASSAASAPTSRAALLLILSEFAHRYVNLTKIESRPSRQGLGDYIFFIDVEGRRADPPVEQALKCLACKLPWVKVLGSYPTCQASS